MQARRRGVGDEVGDGVEGGIILQRLANLIDLTDKE